LTRASSSAYCSARIFGSVELDSHVLVNLTGKIALGLRLTLNARIENLADEDQQAVAGFRIQERSAFIQVRFGQR